MIKKKQLGYEIQVRKFIGQRRNLMKKRKKGMFECQCKQRISLITTLKKKRERKSVVSFRASIDICRQQKVVIN